jgi:hypothetical protein
MRKTLKAIALIAMLMGGVCEARSEHVTPEEIALYSLGSQNTQEFSNQFKQFTKTDLTGSCL